MKRKSMQSILTALGWIALTVGLSSFHEKIEGKKFKVDAREGKKVVATAKITVDRTKYDIKFRSANFFENLGDKAIYNDFELSLKLVAIQNSGV